MNKHILSFTQKLYENESKNDSSDIVIRNYVANDFIKSATGQPSEVELLSYKVQGEINDIYDFERLANELDAWDEPSASDIEWSILCDTSLSTSTEVPDHIQDIVKNLGIGQNLNKDFIEVLNDLDPEILELVTDDGDVGEIKGDSTVEIFFNSELEVKPEGEYNAIESISNMVTKFKINGANFTKDQWDKSLTRNVKIYESFITNSDDNEIIKSIRDIVDKRDSTSVFNKIKYDMHKRKIDIELNGPDDNDIRQYEYLIKLSDANFFDKIYDMVMTNNVDSHAKVYQIFGEDAAQKITGRIDNEFDANRYKFNDNFKSLIGILSKDRNVNSYSDSKKDRRLIRLLNLNNKIRFTIDNFSARLDPENSDSHRQSSYYVGLRNKIKTAKKYFKILDKLKNIKGDEVSK